MKRPALLLLTGALLASTPAQADFFKDLGNALDQIGNDIADTVDDAFTQKPREGENKPTESAQPAPAPAAQPAPPPQTTSFSGATRFNSARQQQRANNTASLGNGRTVPRAARDDAPPPRRAPHREPVQTAYIAPLPGFSEAPARPAATYSPVMAAASLVSVSPSAGIALPSRLPGSKPASVQNRLFALSYGPYNVRVSDTLLQSASTAPTGNTRELMAAVKASLERDSSQRVKLISESLVQDDRLSEARKRSFDRAVLVKSWLEEAGVRPTQVDMDVTGAGDADRVTLTVSK